MFGSNQVIKGLPSKKDENIKYIALVLNESGFRWALESGLDIINYAIVASDTFSIKNQGSTTLENIKIMEKVYFNSSNKIQIAVTIAASFGCPYEGEISTGNLLSIVNRIAKLGLTEI